MQKLFVQNENLHQFKIVKFTFVFSKHSIVKHSMSHLYQLWIIKKRLINLFVFCNQLLCENIFLRAKTGCNCDCRNLNFIKNELWNLLTFVQSYLWASGWSVMSQDIVDKYRADVFK